MSKSENHKTDRIGWLRAAVLGKMTGLSPSPVYCWEWMQPMRIPTASCSQADTEQADVDIERKELARNPSIEHDELAAIYVKRGLDQALASTVATQLMAHDALDAHKRDELGITDILGARPIQAALASAASFSVGAALPLLVVLLAPVSMLIWAMSVSSLLFLALLGALAAWVGGGSMSISAFRVTFWGALAMGLTTGAGAGALFGSGA